MCNEKGCSKSKKYSKNQKLNWKFYPPCDGKIKNLTIDFKNDYSCYNPVLFNGCDPVGCFKFHPGSVDEEREIQRKKNGVYKLEGEVCVSDRESKSYVIKITGTIPCHLSEPTIEICFVSGECKVCPCEEEHHNYQHLVPNCCH